jgi:hypothetical protein
VRTVNDVPYCRLTGEQYRLSYGCEVTELGHASVIGCQNGAETITTPALPSAFPMATHGSRAKVQSVRALRGDTRKFQNSTKS